MGADIRCMHTKHTVFDVSPLSASVSLLQGTNKYSLLEHHSSAPEPKLNPTCQNCRLLALSQVWQGGFRMTCNQSLVLENISEAAVHALMLFMGCLDMAARKPGLLQSLHRPVARWTWLGQETYYPKASGRVQGDAQQGLLRRWPDSMELPSTP